MAKKIKAKKAAKRKVARKPARKAAAKGAARKKTAARRPAKASAKKASARKASKPAARKPAKKKAAAPARTAMRPNTNEGEGNKTADRAYREAATRFGATHDTAALAEQAARDVEANPEPYEAAVEEGRSHSAGDLPQDEN